jgi:hypothetical protein
MICQLGLPPLRPYEVSAFDLAFLLLALRVEINALTYKHLLLLAVPPRTSLNDLPNRLVVISLANIELEIRRALLRLSPIVSFI